MKYKLIAIDLDGTLLNPVGEINPKVRDVIRAAVEAGCLVTLATGRRQKPARLYANELGLKIPLILYTGSLIYDTLTGQPLFQHPMTSEFLEQAIRIVREIKLRPIVLQSPMQGEYIYMGPAIDDDIYSRSYAEDKLRSDLIRRLSYEELSQVKEALILSVTAPLNCLPDLARVFPGKIQINYFGYPLRHKIIKELHAFDLVQAEVSKGKALRWLAQHFGIDPAETMAIGDSSNDLEMLKAAGLGVAMGNASQEVKGVAGAVVGTNAEDGVAEAIERFVLSSN